MFKYHMLKSVWRSGILFKLDILYNCMLGLRWRYTKVNMLSVLSQKPRSVVIENNSKSVYNQVSNLSTLKAWILCKATQLYSVFYIYQGCVQPRQNGAKPLFNRNGGAVNTLFWWRKCWNYGSWEGHSLCSFWIIFRAWWNRYKYVFNTAQYARCDSHCPCCPE